MNIKIEITGLRELITRFSNSPRIIDKELEAGFKKSLMLIERNVKMRTPRNTGRLRSSIGGIEGWRWITSRIASIGTNVFYAYWVEVRQAYHKVGETGYFSKGVQASMEGINKIFAEAMQKVAQKLTGH